MCGFVTGAAVSHTAMVRLIRSQVEQEVIMLRYALIFLVIALLASAFGMFGLSGVAMEAARILFFVFLVLLVISLISGRRNISP